MNKKMISIVAIILLTLLVFTSTCHASASARVFASQKSAYYHDCAVYAIDGLARLGYSPCDSVIGPITRDTMLSWIRNSGNGYAMYVHTLGGTGYFNDYYGYSIDSSMISGNWDFVYIDSAYSAADASLANAFHTTGYTNRCFLGWSNVVLTSDSDLFNYYFWLEFTGKTSIRTAAVNAAACVPGSGTTPIKLYGSTTYTGAAR